VVTKSKARLITVEERRSEQLSMNFTKFLFVHVNHVLSAFSTDFYKNVFLVVSSF